MSTIRGIAWPFAFHAGRVATSEDEDHVLQSIRQIIAVGKREYLFRPTFGCDLHRRVFDPINAVAMVDGDIREALARWEPRVEVLTTDVDRSRAAEGLLGVMVNVRIIGLNIETTADAVIRS